MKGAGTMDINVPLVIKTDDGAVYILGKANLWGYRTIEASGTERSGEFPKGEKVKIVGSGTQQAHHLAHKGKVVIGLPVVFKFYGKDLHWTSRATTHVTQQT